MPSATPTKGLEGRQITVGMLSPSRQRLVSLMQRLEYGEVQGLVLRQGEPQFDPPPRVIRTVRFGQRSATRVTPRGEDFALKRHVAELFAEFDRLQDGVIGRIEVQNGLPCRISLVLGAQQIEDMP